MTIGNSVGKASAAWIAITALLLAPATTRARELKAIRMQSGDSLQDSQEARDKEQEKREREQEAREREEEKREREQEARERVQEKIERLQELYDDGREDLDEDRYDRAADKFRQLADLNGPQTDAALYWKAYAENRMGKRDTALATIADMKPLAKRRYCSGDRSKAIHRATCKASRPERRRIENAGHSRADEQRPGAHAALARESDQRFGHSKGKIEGALCAGAKRVGTGTRDSGQNRARPDQSGPPTQGG